MSDDVTKVTVTKYDITGGKEIAGAKLQVIDSDGNIVDKWFSGEYAHEINGVLEAGGEYTLHEELAPDGYIIASDVTFTVDENGEVTKVAMYDDTTKVHISKRDITTDKELPGAKLQILDGDTVIEEWVSTEEEYIIEGKLIAGKEYILREITAPEGYEVANDVTFKVSEDGSVDHVIMYDEHKPEEEKPHEDTPHNDTPHSNTPSSGGGTVNPHTGAPEVSNKAAIILACAGLLLVVSMFIRKDDKDED